MKIYWLTITLLFFFRNDTLHNAVNFHYLPAGRKTCDSESTGFAKGHLPKSADSINFYLTIDDGPSAASFYLSNLAIADSFPINMFIIGNRVMKNESSKIFFDLYQNNPFIEIGNHSYSHANKHYHEYYTHPEQVVNDFHLNADTINLPVKIARLPGRNTWHIAGRKRTDLPDDSTAANMLAAEGFNIFGWDIEWHCGADSTAPVLPADFLFRQIKEIVHSKKSFTPGNIVLLCHEVMFENAENRVQLAMLIQLIKQDKIFRFCFLRNYPESSVSSP